MQPLFGLHAAWQCHAEGPAHLGHTEGGSKKQHMKKEKRFHPGINKLINAVLLKKSKLYLLSKRGD